MDQPTPGRITELGGYEIIAKVGQGGMGAVYKARQKSLDRIVALKVLPPRLAQNAKFIERFMREARASAKLNHPNIVQGIDVGFDKGLYYFAMEFIEGRTLRDILKERGTLAEREAALIIRQMAQALDCAQQAGLIHRDIKPDNILLGNDGMAKLADLGLAKEVGEDSSLTQTGTSVGTPYYISPEQAKGEKDLDIRADLYSLGATWFHLVTGRVLYEGETSAIIMVKHLNEAAPKAHRVNSQVSEGCGKLIDRLVRKNREQRIQTPKQLIEQIDGLLSGGAIGTTGPRAPVSERRRAVSVKATGRGEEGKKSPAAWLIAAGAGAVVLLAVLAAMMGGGGEKERRQSAGKTKEAAKAQEVVKMEEKTPKKTKQVEEQQPGSVAKQGEELARMLVYVAEWEKKNPEAYAELEERYGKVAKAAKGTTAELKIRDEVEAALRKVRERWDGAAEKAWNEKWGKAEGLAKNGDYDGALKELANVPETFKEQLTGRTREKAQALRTEAEAKINAAMAEGEKRLAELEPEKGLEALAAVEKTNYGPLSGQVEELKGKLGAAAGDIEKLKAERGRREAEKKLGAYLAQFDAAVLGGKDWAEGKRVAEEAGKDGSLGEYRATAAALKEVVEAVEKVKELEQGALKKLENQEAELEWRGQKVRGRILKVSGETLEIQVHNGPKLPIKLADLSEAQRARFRGEWKPETPAQKLTTALTRLQGTEKERDLDEAEKWLREAEGYALTGRYRERIRIWRVGEAEAAAEDAWKALAAKAEKPDLEHKAAESLKPLLDEFLVKHKDSQFRKNHEAEIEALKTKIAVSQEVRNYKGVWTAKTPKVFDMDGKETQLPPFVQSGVAYDSKRKLCVLYDGIPRRPRNDLWTYDLEKDEWICLRESGVGMRPAPFQPGTGFSLDFCYDQDRDLYWTFDEKSLWRYDPNAKTWTREEKFDANRKRIRGLAYSVALKTPVSLQGPLNLGKGEIEPLGEAPKHLSDYYWPSSALTCGFAGPDERGRFISFGSKSGSPDIWVFDPPTAQWTAIRPENPPPGRSRSNMVYHSRLKVFVLFGGNNVEGEPFSDTWLYAPHLNAWSELKTEPRPENVRRAGRAIWYDEARDQVVLFSAGKTWSLKVSPDYVAPAGALPTPVATQTALAGMPQTAADIQKLFKGTVVSFDPNTRRIALAYEFQGGFEKSELKEDWMVRDSNQSQRRHVAVFEGNLEFTCKEFMAGSSLDERLHGGVDFLDAGGNWLDYRTGLTYGERDKTKIIAQIWRPGSGRHKGETAFPGGERKIDHCLKVSAGRQGPKIAYSVDSKGEMERETRSATVALRPFLPNRDAILSVRVVGSLQKAWLDQNLKATGISGGERAGDRTPTKAEIQRLFKGVVADFDPNSLHVRVVYDFGNPEQQHDWDFGNRKGIEIKDNHLHVGGAGFQLKAVMQPTQIRVIVKDMLPECLRFGVEGMAVATVRNAGNTGAYVGTSFQEWQGPETKKIFLREGKINILTLNIAGDDAELIVNIPSRSREDEKVSGKVKERIFGRPEWRIYGQKEFKEISVSGILDRDWLESARTESMRK